MPALAAIAFASAIAWSVPAVQGEESEGVSQSPEFLVSKETTYLTEPLAADGTVDYVAAVNERRSRGVTADNNSVVLFWQGIGVTGFPEPQRDAYFKELGAASPVDESDDFVPLDSFVKSRKPDWDDDTLFDYYDQIEPTRTRPWTAEQFPLLAEWIELNSRSLARLAEGAQRDRFYSPIVRDENKIDTDVAFPPLATGLSKAVSLLGMRAMLYLGEGRFNAAWRDLETCLRMARLTTASGSLGFALYGSSVANAACNRLCVFVQYAKLNAAQYAWIQKQLRDVASVSVMSEEVTFSERCLFLEFIAARAKLAPEERKRREAIDLKLFEICFGREHDIDWNAVLRLANKHFNQMLEIARIDDPRERKEKMDQFAEQLGTLDGQLPRTDDLPGLAALGDLQDPEGFKRLLVAADSPLGRAKLVASALSSFFAAAWSSMKEFDDRSTEQFRLTEIAVALAAYRREEAEYPDELKQLEENHLDPLPRSVLTGNEFEYVRSGDGYVLSSSGSGGVAGVFNDMTIVDRREHEEVVAMLKRNGTLLEERRGEVRHVALLGADFDDDDLSRLTILAELESLSLRGTQVTDRGVAKLKTFNRLWSLDLSETAITDVGLKSLSALTKLSFLQLEGTAVSDDAIARLQQTLPNCKITVK